MLWSINCVITTKNKENNVKKFDFKKKIRNYRLLRILGILYISCINQIFLIKEGLDLVQGIMLLESITFEIWNADSGQTAVQIIDVITSF